MVSLQKLPSTKKILVIGDLILDVYTFGQVSRVSPEAPISVLHEKRQEYKLGGAANVADNLLSLGMHVTLCGRIGDDQEGKQLLKLFEVKQIKTDLIVVDQSIPTTKKNRFIASSQQMLRVDREETSSFSVNLENQLFEKIQSKLAEFDAIVFSDYAKGFLTFSLIQSVIQLARKYNIPSIVDPKGKDFAKYKGANIIKPNEKEAYLATPFSMDRGLEAAALCLLEETSAEALFITRAEKGISIFTKSEVHHYPAIKQDVIDVTGAGDTVLAVLSACVADQINLDIAAKMANVAASISIEHVGCISVTFAEIHERFLALNQKNKVFDQTNEALLYKLIQKKHFALVELIDSVMTIDLFETLRKQKEEFGTLLIYLSQKLPIIELLEVMTIVDYVAIGLAELKHLAANFQKISDPLSIAIA